MKNPCWGSRGWGSRGWGSTRLGLRILELAAYLPVLAGGLEAGGLEAQSKKLEPWRKSEYLSIGFAFFDFLGIVDFLSRGA